MDYREEIQIINKKIGELVTAVALIQERRINDKEGTKKLAEELDKVAIAMNRLNLTLENKDGIQKGKSTVMKWVWAFFGGLIFAWVIWVSASITNDTKDIIKAKTDIKNHEAIKHKG